MYCKECGAEIEDGKFCSECGTPIKSVENIPEENKNEMPNWGFLVSKDFNKWSQGIGATLIIWGIVNLFWAPIFGIILLFFGILIYILKSSNLIILFGAIWLFVSLYQLYIALFLIDSYFILAVVNGLFAIYLLYMVNKYKIKEDV